MTVKYDKINSIISKPGVKKERRTKILGFLDVFCTFNCCVIEFLDKDFELRLLTRNNNNNNEKIIKINQ